jgi:hypothetical protein
MATPHHQQSVQRKVLYIGLILALFFALVFYRPYVVEARAEELSLREEDRGDVELASKAVTLGLTGLRGIVVTALWSSAKDKMEKNQWNELELLVRSVTKLQPHFVTPWIFQSWNLSYNVAVQCDREADQYFYITRGIELLTEGERQNKYNPDMRYFVGFYNQHKIMLADHTSMLAALYHMSCIDPVKRDPRRFRKPDAQGRMSLDMVEFEKFCQESPQLVRRLREKVFCETPELVVRFLEENQRVPSIFEDDPERTKRPYVRDAVTKLRPVADRYPSLPPGPQRQDAGSLTSDSKLEDHVDIDAFQVARAWFSYAVEALPEPSWIPGRYKPITDPVRYKIPKFTTQIFRNYPARSQSYAATRLEEDGWFDEQGWLIPGWFPRDQFSDQKPARIGGGRKWVQESWGEAYRLWKEIGEKHGLYLTAEQEHDLIAKAKVFVDKFPMATNQPPPDIPEEDIKDESMKAFIYMWNYSHYRTLTNFPHFLAQAQVFALPETVEARGRLYRAERAKTQGDRIQAVEEYDRALTAYNEILKKHEHFRMDGGISEEALEHEWAYIGLCRELYGPRWKQALAAQAFLGLSASGPLPVPACMPLAQLARPHLLPDMDINGPFDDTFGVEFMDQFKKLKDPARGKGPPPGVDMRQMMMERAKGSGMTPPGMRPPSQMPQNMQQPPEGMQMPKGMQMPPGMKGVPFGGKK